MIAVYALAALFIAPSGCGCRSPERPLPSTDDPKYAATERLIERTLQPTIYVFPGKLTSRPAEIQELAALGYFHRTRPGYMPTPYGQRHATVDAWPHTLVETPHYHYERDDVSHISFSIGTYEVQKLTAADHYDAAPCGAFDDEHDTYDFVGVTKLNSLGRILLSKHLLYLLTDNSHLRRWDGKRKIHGIWSVYIFGGARDYQSVRNHGENVDLESSLQ